MHRKKIGIIGLGYWGRNILRNLNELGTVFIACDTDSEAIRISKERLPEIEYTLSVNDVFENSQIDAVIISTPAVTHYELVKRALNADKDVFVEKPIALNLEHGSKLVELAIRENKILMVGHLLQYHPAVIRLSKFIKDGGLGNVEYIYSNRLNIGKLRVEENILWSFAPHDISVILALLEDEPIKIDCFGESYLNEGIYDTTLTMLEFKSKIKAHIFVSWLHPFKEQKLIVVGSKAMAVFDDMAKEKLSIYPHTIKLEHGKPPVAYKAKHYCLEVDDKEPLKEEISHFIKSISERKTPRTDGREAMRVLRVINSAEESLRKRLLT